MTPRVSVYFSDDFKLSPGSSLIHKGTGTVLHEIHRIRRQALNPLFAKGSIRAAEPQLILHVDRLMTKFELNAVSNTSLSLFTVLLAFTTDVLSDFIFHIELGMLDDDDRAAA